MTAAQRDKGKRGERALARRLRESFPELAESIKRGWQTRVGCDDPDVCGLSGFWIESKIGKKPNPRAAYAQAHEDAKGRAIPLAVVRDDRAHDALCTLSLTDLIRVLRSAYGFDPPLIAQLAKDAAE